MAKFKVGDVVSVKREAAEMIDNPALARKRGRVTKVLPGGYYEVDGELGATGLELTDAELTLANSRACNSTNTVVANALAAANLRRVVRNSHFFCDERDYESAAAVKKEYPGQIVKKVTGGWMVFDTIHDYETWKMQK